MATSAIRSAPSRQHRPGPIESRSTCTDFTAGGEFGVGAEEELFLLDSTGRLDPTESRSIIRDVQRASRADVTVSAELFAAQIEFATAVCRDASAIVPQLAELRSTLRSAGGRALAAGLHPNAPFGDAVLTNAPRYRRIGGQLTGLLRTPTAAFQVHVGVPDEAAALRAYRGIRHRLAVVQALACSSPFWHGRDSGLASARWAVISSYPRSGVPPILRTWEEYASLIDATTAAAEVPDYTHVWWDARLQPRLGTIEVRVMDAQSSLTAAAGLAALVQGLVRHAVENPVSVDVPSAVLAENSFRAARHGTQTTLADLDGHPRPVRELAITALRDARAALAADGLDRPLDAVEEILARAPEHQRQRSVHARSGIDGVLGDLIARTELGI